MNRYILITAALLGALSVILGAFGAHALKNRIPSDALEIFETSIRYQFYHVFALLAVGILAQFSYMERKVIYCGNNFILRFALFTYLF